MLLWAAHFAGEREQGRKGRTVEKAKEAKEAKEAKKPNGKPLVAGSWWLIADG